MNPAGCLPRQVRNPVSKQAQIPPDLAHCYRSEAQMADHTVMHNNMEEDHHFGSVRQPSIRSNNHFTGSSMLTNPLYLEQEEERYVKGAF